MKFLSSLILRYPPLAFSTGGSIGEANVSKDKSEIKKFPGGYSCKVTPVPIPNTVVKLTASMILGWRRPGKADTARFK